MRLSWWAWVSVEGTRAGAPGQGVAGKSCCSDKSLTTTTLWTNWELHKKLPVLGCLWPLKSSLQAAHPGAGGKPQTQDAVSSGPVGAMSSQRTHLFLTCTEVLQQPSTGGRKPHTWILHRYLGLNTHTPTAPGNSVGTEPCSATGWDWGGRQNFRGFTSSGKTLPGTPRPSWVTAEPVALVIVERCLHLWALQIEQVVHCPRTPGWPGLTASLRPACSGAHPRKWHHFLHVQRHSMDCHGLAHELLGTEVKETQAHPGCSKPQFLAGAAAH